MNQLCLKRSLSTLHNSSSSSCSYQGVGGHLSICSGLTHPEVSSKLFLGFFCLLVCSVFINLGDLLRGIWLTLRNLFKEITWCYFFSLHVSYFTTSIEVAKSSARNGNLEVAVYFLKAKQGYTVRKVEKGKWIQYIMISAGLKLRDKRSSCMVYRRISSTGSIWYAANNWKYFRVNPLKPKLV
jgi:hypothetical protein